MSTKKPSERPMDQGTLTGLIKYDAETGIIQSRFGRRIGHIDRQGYEKVVLLGKTYSAHRVIWMLLYGRFPTQIDHIDGDRANNRLANLREVSVAQNNRNMRRRKDNTSGCTGVDFEKRKQKWRAQIAVSGKDINLGYFGDIDSAIAARKAAERQYGFHDNHGRSV